LAELAIEVIFLQVTVVVLSKAKFNCGGQPLRRVFGVLVHVPTPLNEPLLKALELAMLWQ